MSGQPMQPMQPSPRRRRNSATRLVVGLLVFACCSSGVPPVGGLLTAPAGMALANTLLFIANQAGNELHVFDTQARQFLPSPNVMFPLSVPTVRSPGAVCGNALQMFTISTVDSTLGVIDAFDDFGNPDPADPPLGLRELGQIALPGIASDAVCTESPAAVLAHEIAVAGSVGNYAVEVDAGTLLIDDVVQPDGGERGAIAALPTAALLPINEPDGTCAGGTCIGTQIWQASNDQSCGDAGATHGFCPTLQPLMTLPAQTPGLCDPIVGAPFALRVDASGANVGDMTVGVPNVDPSTLNRLVASDRNSSCVASVDLNDLSVHWLYANGPTSAVYTMPFVPGTCLPGGDLVAAVADSENCERQGPPPVGGYQTCDGVSFLSLGQGGLLPEPLPYPFTPRRPLPPIRIFDLVQKVTFVGPNVLVTDFGPLNPIPIQMLAVVGTGSGNLVYVDIGIGSPNGGAGADDAGIFACPAAYLAPRIFDQNDYLTDPIPPQISSVTVSYIDGGPNLGAVTQVAAADALTAQSTATPTIDRLGATFNTPVGTNGQPLDIETCYEIPSGAELCVTSGLVQKGVAENETFVVTYGGPIPSFGEASGFLTGDSLQLPGFADLTTIDDGLLVAESGLADGGNLDGGNLTVELFAGSSACGDYAISAVTPTALTLTPTPTCASGNVVATIVASGAKPYTVQGTSSGFQNQLWPMDGTLHLVTSQRWHYPADLIGMLHGAEQLADFVDGPVAAVAAPGSTVSAPRSDGQDSAALDSSFGLALRSPLGIVGVDAGLDSDGGLGFLPVPGATWTFSVTNGIQPLIITPTGVDTAGADALIDGMASYSDSDGGHVYATFRGGNALVELVPAVANEADLFVFH